MKALEETYLAKAQEAQMSEQELKEAQQTLKERLDKVNKNNVSIHINYVIGYDKGQGSSDGEQDEGDYRQGQGLVHSCFIRVEA